MRVGILGLALVMGAALLPAWPTSGMAQTKAPAAAAHAPLRREYVLFFDQDSATITARAARIIEQAVQGIAARRKAGTLATVKVVGYSDTADTNDDADRSLKLSADRASAVRNSLVAQGVPADILSSEGRGKTSLAVKTREHVSNIRNRRVRIVMFAPGE